MKKVITQTHPSIYATMGGAILGSSIGGVFGVLSGETLAPRWQFLIFSCIVLLLDGILLTVLSVYVHDLAIAVESYLRFNPSSKKEDVISEFYDAQKGKFLLLFWLSILMLILGFILLFFGPTYVVSSAPLPVAIP